jgi:hypothetical protein
MSQSSLRPQKEISGGNTSNSEKEQWCGFSWAISIGWELFRLRRREGKKNTMPTGCCGPDTELGTLLYLEEM